MNSTYGKFGSGPRGYGQSEAAQASKLVQCRPGPLPGQIICTAVGPDGRPTGPPPMYDAVRYAGYGGRFGTWGRHSRYGAAVAPVSSSSSKTITTSSTMSSSPIASSTMSASSPIASSTMSSSSPSSYVSSVVPSSSSVLSSVSPSYESSSAVVPSTSSASTVVQSTGSGDSPYYNPFSSSMQTGSQGYYQAPEDTRYIGEGDEDGPGMYDEEEYDDEGGGGDDDAGFPGERDRARKRRKPRGRGYPAGRRRKKKLRRLRRRSYSGYTALYGATVDPWWGTKMRYTDKRGSGGYGYRQYVNGDIHIIDAPVSIADVFWPAPVGGKAPSRQWAAITKEIGATSPTYAALAASYTAQQKKSNAYAQAAQVPTSVVVTGQNNKGLNALFAALGQGDKKTGQKLVGQAALQYGPEVAESASEFLKEKSSSPAALQKKIDRAKVKLAKAKAKHDTVKVRRLQAKIKGLQARLLTAQAEAAGVIDTTTMAASSGFPWKYVLGGLLGVALIAVLAKTMMK